MSKGQNYKTSYKSHKCKNMGVWHWQLISCQLAKYHLWLAHQEIYTSELLICDKTKWTLIISIQQIMQAYHARGFRITTILSDGGFKCIRINLAEMGISLNIMSRNEHVPEVEWYIRTIKERVQTIAVSLPFKNYLPRLIVEMVYNVVFWLNSLPHNDGVSPRTLITGLAIDYHKHCKIGFGTYAQVHEEGNNSLRQRTSGATALWLTGNYQGRHYFLSLHSGKRINRYTWTELPMPNEVIAQVHWLASREIWWYSVHRHGRQYTIRAIYRRNQQWYHEQY